MSTSFVSRRKMVIVNQIGQDYKDIYPFMSSGENIERRK